ncbi:MAG: hypothetical protein SWH68_00455, partial [Thermodesulfobacteriota bacterium]|nr:hypothetical protein [Thermodesulfobacteriota bacterium]
FARFLCQSQILILKIRKVFLRLKFSPSLNSTKISNFWMDTNSRGGYLLAAVLLYYEKHMVLVLTLRVLRELRGSGVDYHEEHEGHEDKCIALNAPFMFDDKPNILDNPHIRMTSFSLADILEAARGRTGYRPLVNLSLNTCAPIPTSRISGTQNTLKIL